MPIVSFMRKLLIKYKIKIFFKTGRVRFVQKIENTIQIIELFD